MFKFTLKNKVQIFFKSLREDGIRFAFIKVIALILNQPLEIEKAKLKSAKIIYKKYKNQIAYGPFKGMVLPAKNSWSKFDTTLQILASYEEHILEKILYFSKKGNYVFIDIGAADGFYAVGFAYINYFKKIFAFDINPDARKIIRENSIINSCHHKIEIYSEANLESITNIINLHGNAVILIDIEGDEYELLTSKLLSLLKKCYIICELHPFFTKDGVSKQKKIIKDSKKYFHTSCIKRNIYRPNDFIELDDLSDEERLITFGEKRQKNMEWLVLEPK